MDLLTYYRLLFFCLKSFRSETKREEVSKSTKEEESKKKEQARVATLRYSS